MGLVHWVVSANIRLEQTAGITRFIVDTLEACPAVGRCSGGALDELEMKMKNTNANPGNLGEGVYWAPEHYAGLVRRFVIIGVDSVVICFVPAIIIVLVFDLPKNIDQIFSSKTYVFLLFSYLYLAIIKRSEWGTVGYRLTGVRIVNLEGKVPSLWRMTFRFLLLIFGPFHILIDILWLGGDENKQTLRDKIVGTYVIKHDAPPLGRGPQQLVAYYLLGWNFWFREVRRSVAA
jgi:uncharacterized RDD family membrane protein YckC